MPFSYRCTCPWSGRMFVEVCLTMTAFFSESTTCRDEPVIVAPFLGSTMPTTAGEDGREPVVELVGVSEPLEPGPPHAARTVVSSAQAATLAMRRVRSPAM